MSIPTKGELLSERERESKREREQERESKRERARERERESEREREYRFGKFPSAPGLHDCTFNQTIDKRLLDVEVVLRTLRYKLELLHHHEIVMC